MKPGALLATTVAALIVGSAPASAGVPMTVGTTVSARFLYFADTVTARVTVLADRREVDPSSIRVSTEFGDWSQVAPTQMTSSSAGPYVRRSWSIKIACLQTSCLPNGKQLAVRLPPATVSATRADHSTLTVQRAWPALTIAGRFGPAPPNGIPHFVLDQDLPATTYRVPPTTLAFGLDAGAALLAAFCLWVVVREVLRRRPTPTHEHSPLARALRYIRQAKIRPSDDRRRAAGLLARTLAANRDSLADTASRVAWSADDPEPERLEELARLVETRPGERS